MKTRALRPNDLLLDATIGAAFLIASTDADGLTLLDLEDGSSGTHAHRLDDGTAVTVLKHYRVYREGREIL